MSKRRPRTLNPTRLNVMTGGRVPHMELVWPHFACLLHTRLCVHEMHDFLHVVYFCLTVRSTVRPAAHQVSILLEASVSSRNVSYENSPSYIQTEARTVREQTFEALRSI